LLADAGSGNTAAGTSYQSGGGGDFRNLYDFFHDSKINTIPDSGQTTDDVDQ